MFQNLREGMFQDLHPPLRSRGLNRRGAGTLMARRDLFGFILARSQQYLRSTAVSHGAFSYFAELFYQSLLTPVNYASHILDCIPESLSAIKLFRCYVEVGTYFEPTLLFNWYRIARGQRKFCCEVPSAKAQFKFGQFFARPASCVLIHEKPGVFETVSSR